jgi:predicted kinase
MTLPLLDPNPQFGPFQAVQPADTRTSAELLAGDERQAAAMDDYLRVASEQVRLAGTSSSRLEAMSEAIDNRIASVREATGQTLDNPLRGGYRREAAQRVRARAAAGEFDPNTTLFARIGAEQMNIFNEQVDTLATRHPDKAAALSFYQPIAEQAGAIATNAESAAQIARQKVIDAGGGAGSLFANDLFAGLWGSRRDPMMVASLGLGPTGAVGRQAVMRVATAAITQGLVNIGLAQAEKPAVEAWKRERGQVTGSALLTPAEVGLAFVMGAIPGAGIQGGAELAGRNALKRVIGGEAGAGDIEKAARFAGVPLDRDFIATMRAGEQSAAADRMLDDRPPGVPPSLHAETTRQAIAHAEDPAQPPPALPTIAAPELPAVDHDLARFANLNDAVAWLRETPERTDAAMASERPDTRMAGRLAGLSDEAWSLVRDGAAAPAHAAIVHEQGVPPELQAAVLERASAARPADLDEARAVIVDAHEAEADRAQRAAIASGPAGEADLRAQLAAGASVAELAQHPFVVRAVAEQRARLQTGTIEHFEDPTFRANRVFDFDGERVQGYDAAIARLTDQARAFGGEAENGRHAVIVIGPPASGKSTVAGPLAKRNRAAIVDSDEAKKVIPEYQGGAGTVAVHEESSVLAGHVLENLVVEGTNLVLPKVGERAGRIRELAQVLKEAGYTVDLIHAGVPAEVAGRRNMERFLKTGRLVLPEFLADAARKTGESYYILKNEGLFRETANVDTTSGIKVIDGAGPLADALRGRGNIGPRAGEGRAAGDRADQGQAQEIAGTPVPSMPAHRVVAGDGRAVDVQPIVVEASSLTTSTDAGFDSRLQPRQRERAASQAQIRDIAANLAPERLGVSTEADRGAPIVGPDGMVESGNARVLALRQVYGEGGDAAQRYREWLAQQGVDTSKFQQPVLVRQRVTELTPQDRAAFTVAANQSATLTMSAGERALADARAITPEMLGLIRTPADLGALGNRDFVRAFIERLPQTEQGALVDAGGALSSEGLARVRNAVLARAYGDASVLSRIAEATNDQVKSISNALTAVAPTWARLRADVEAVRVRADMDLTPQLMEAVTRTADMRAKGLKLAEYLAQRDAFDQLSTPVENFMRMFYDPKGGRALSAERIADGLTFYAEEARKVTTEQGLDLGLAPVGAADLQGLAAKRSAPHEANQPELFAGGVAGDRQGERALGGEIPGPEPGGGGGAVGEGGAAAAQPQRTADLIPFVDERGANVLMAPEELARAGDREQHLSDLVGACKAA